MKEVRMFFFEKKNKKTFVSLPETHRKGSAQSAKVLCFFFSKKKALLP
jgi:hypothetical protein